jgi:hypothetical protein
MNIIKMFSVPAAISKKNNKMGETFILLFFDLHFPSKSEGSSRELQGSDLLRLKYMD